MKVLNVQLCSCEFMLDLTSKDTFEGLDQALVDTTQKLTTAQQVTLYLGVYSEIGTHKVLAQSHSSLQGSEDSDKLKVIPVTLISGQSLSLVFCAELSGEQLSQVGQLLALYTNQHQHLVTANKDRLTNLKNRRAFDNEYTKLFSDMCKSSELAGCSYVLALVDLDHFKRINDHYGHLLGDETLVLVANLMKDFFDLSVGLYRFGGEEFVVLLPDCTHEKAAVVLDRLRQAVESYEFPQVGQVTISAGYVMLNSAIRSDILFERADAALYYAKSSGRNCIKFYDDLVEKNVIEAVPAREGGIELF